MKKIIFALFVLFTVISQFSAQGYGVDNRTGILTGTENVIDTIDLKNPLLKTQLVIVEVYSGTIIITHSQDGYTARDTTASYDSVTSTDKVIQYINRQNKYVFITPRGGSATYQVKWSYGNGYGIKLGTGGSTAAPANLYGYAHEDTANVFTKYNTFNDTVKLQSVLNVKRIRLFDQTASTYLQIGDSTFRNGISIGSLNSSDGFDFNAGGVNVGWARNSYWSFGPGTTGLGRINLTVGNDAKNVYSFYGDDNTGFNRPSADRIHVATGGTARIVITNDSTQITNKLMLVRDIDTVDFASGGSGSVGQTGQVCKILVTNQNVTGPAICTVSNSYITTTSIITVSVQVLNSADLERIVGISFNITADGSMDIIYQANSLSSDVWLHYTIH